MAKRTRTRIGLRFSYDENWIGGSYYIINLIKALNGLDDVEKPQLTIIASKQSEFDHVKAIQYPYIDFKKINVPTVYRIVNKLGRMVGRNNAIDLNKKIQPITENFDLLFPGSGLDFFKNVSHQLFWIPDLQEKHLPQFFDKKEIQQRETHHKELTQNSENILFSSYDALNDFKNNYAVADPSKLFVLNFAVTHPDYTECSINQLKEKFRIPTKYFFSPNQFWKHKNHLLILETLKLIKEKGQLDFLVVFTGKEHDPRNPNYFTGLKDFVRKNELENNVRFLGFIDRKEQLQLMNHSIAVIQPSLFEGWSTVVEDAKAMNQNIISSDLAVHKEQLGELGNFFDRNSKEELADLLLHFKEGNIQKPEFSYQNKIKKFGEEFIRIVEALTKEMAYQPIENLDAKE